MVDARIILLRAEYSVGFLDRGSVEIGLAHQAIVNRPDMVVGNVGIDVMNQVEIISIREQSPPSEPIRMNDSRIVQFPNS